MKFSKKILSKPARNLDYLSSENIRTVKYVHRLFLDMLNIHDFKATSNNHGVYFSIPFGPINIHFSVNTVGGTYSNLYVLSYNGRIIDISNSHKDTKIVPIELYSTLVQSTLSKRWTTLREYTRYGKESWNNLVDLAGSNNLINIELVRLNLINITKAAKNAERLKRRKLFRKLK